MKQKWTQMMILGGLTAVVVMGTGCKKETPDSILKEAVKSRQRRNLLTVLWKWI